MSFLKALMSIVLIFLCDFWGLSRIGLSQCEHIHEQIYPTFMNKGRDVYKLFKSNESMLLLFKSTCPTAPELKTLTSLNLCYLYRLRSVRPFPEIYRNIL